MTLVRCVDASGVAYTDDDLELPMYQYLTKGRTYTVIGTDADMIAVIDDTHQEGWYLADRFETAE